MTISKPARASSRQIARPMRLPPPVTSAAPRRAPESVNPTERDEVDGGEDGDEAENDGESQHGMLLVRPGNRAGVSAVQGWRRVRSVLASADEPVAARHR